MVQFLPRSMNIIKFVKGERTLGYTKHKMKGHLILEIKAFQVDLTSSVAFINICIRGEGTMRACAISTSTQTEGKEIAVQPV